MKFKWIFITLGLISLSACSSAEPQEVTEEKKFVPQVSLLTVESGLEQSFDITGDVLPLRSTQITSEQRGKVTQVNFKEGDKVEANARVLSINSPDIAASVRTAANNLQSAKGQLESTRLSAQETIRSAEVSLETAELNLKNTLKQNEAAKKQAEENVKSTETSLKLNIAAAETELNNSIKSIRPTVQNAFNVANLIIGATNAYRDLDNDSRDLIGVAKVNSKNEAENNLIQLESMLASSPSNYTEALQILIKAEEAMEKTLIALNNSTTGEKYTQSQLIADINSVTPQLSTIQTTINNLNSRKAALDNAKQSNNKSSQTLIQAEATLESTLAQLEANERSAQKAVESARINLENAKKSAQLSESSAKSSLSSIAGQYDLALVNQGKLTIEAPFKGQIRELLVKEGEEVNPGSSLFTIEDVSEIKIIAFLSAKDIENIKIGDQVEINQGAISAPIHSISSSPDPITKKYRVEIRSADENLKPGALINLKFKSDSKKTSSDKLFIPLTSIHILPGDIFVWIVENEKVMKKAIEIGEISGNFVEVKNGLIAGDRIVDESGRLIEEEGTEVSVTNP